MQFDESSSGESLDQLEVGHTPTKVIEIVGI